VHLDPTTLPALTVNLEHGDTDDETCRVLPLDWFEILTAPNVRYPGYGEFEVNVSMLVVPADIDADWFESPSSRWMRKKIHRAHRLGYEFGPFEFNDYIDDMYDINTSKWDRQGRPMSEEYRVRPPERAPLPDHPCPRHSEGWFGVFQDGKLCAYLFVQQSGEATFTPNILGHADHLENGVMALALFEAVKWQRERANTSYVYYYLHDSETSGLQFFKEKMGYAGHLVTWELSRR
jgi:hypothetical protein